MAHSYKNDFKVDLTEGANSFLTSDDRFRRNN